MKGEYQKYCRDDGNTQGMFPLWPSQLARPSPGAERAFTPFQRQRGRSCAGALLGAGSRADAAEKMLGRALQEPADLGHPQVCFTEA